MSDRDIVREIDVMRRRVSLDVGVVFLVSGSVGMLGCGGDVPRPSLPSPEYERPSVTPWPPVTNEGRQETSQRQATPKIEDAGEGSGQLDASILH